MSKKPANSLYFGDNLAVIRESIADESVDLVYLDPPFNSARDYNILFASPKGVSSAAQITAFEDSWHWGQQAEKEFNEIVHSSNTKVAEIVLAMRRFLGENDMMAYLTMMANRLLELHRVMKPTASLYLHCDNTASHYLKVVLDGVFGQKNYRNEITWKRTSTHSDSKTWSRNSDCIFFYTKGAEFVWNTPRDQHSPQYLADKYRHDDKDGRGLYQLDNMTSPNPRPNLMYVWKGFAWPKKGWRFELATMEKLDAEGRIWYPQNKQGQPDVRKRPRIKRYLAEMDGGVIGSVWSDIAPINSQARERLGYPTQKPLALLERIVAASSNPGDVLLDPFCGCGTAVHAAQRLDRRWLGIDITHLAISLIEKRLKDAFKGIAFDVHGVPKDIDGARELAGRDKYQFQWWACSLVNAQPYQGKKKGADGGIDGLIFFQDEAKGHKKIVVSVKAGSSVDVAMVRDLAHVVLREKAEIGLFLTLTPPTKPMVTEAVKVGYYTSPGTGTAFPKVQILTIAGLLNGTERALFPDLSQGASTFKKAQREEHPGQQSSIF